MAFLCYGLLAREQIKAPKISTPSASINVP
uniref:Uncharacterized protein n=1 Tax=Anguilla anguilla TaxID=7936 RepID=A0A0E9SGI1_ANGAN